MRNGFTLIEVLLVLALVSGLASLSLPIGLTFYRNQIVDETGRDVASVLHRARSQAMSQKNDSPFGVELLSGSYVLFQGTSYALRSALNDEIFSLPTGLSVSGLAEIVYSKPGGTTTVSGIITLSSVSTSTTITVNQQGLIERK